ncbi:hypothetical protein [Streptomyces sp. MJM1172]|nr:hypothetical protein [Streptomyces sp. MJM1172]
MSGAQEEQEDGARIRALPADLAAVADTTVLLYPRERLYAPRWPEAAF